MKWYIYILVLVLISICYYIIRDSRKQYEIEKRYKSKSTHRNYIQYILTGLISGTILALFQVAINFVQYFFHLHISSPTQIIDISIAIILFIVIIFTIIFMIITHSFKFYPKN